MSECKHFWSAPMSHDMQECLWCHARRPSSLAPATGSAFPPDTGDDSLCNVRRLRARIRELESDGSAAESEIALLTAGREQDQAELKICVNALDRIACDREWITRKDMIQISGRALCDIGAWREVKQGEFARHGEILSNPAVVSMMNIQHEETGRLQEWPVDKPIPHGWARVSGLYLPNAESNDPT